MLPQGSYFRRLFLSYFAIAFIAIAALSVFAGYHVRALRFEAQLKTLYAEGRLAYALIENDLRNNHKTALVQKLIDIGHAIGCRFTIIDNNGRVMADTEADPATMNDHRLRPEIVAAAARGEGYSVRFSQTVKQELMYLAHRQTGADQSVYFVRLAVPVNEIEKELINFDGFVVLGAIAALLASALGCFYLARRHSMPIVELSDFAQALATGDYTRRAAPTGEGEISSLARALNAAAERLNALQADASSGQAELAAVLKGMPVGVIAADSQQRIFLVNAAAARLFELDPAGMEGKALWETVREDSVLQAATQVLKDEKPANLRFGPVHGRHVEVSIAPLTNGARTGLLVVAQDATKSVQYGELRKEFVANVSHELRTPLTFIMGFVETLRDGAMENPAKAAQYLATIDKHVRQLKNLVDDLLEISKLESRSSLPRSVSVDLRETIQKVVDLVAPAAAKKAQALIVELPPALPALKGDPDYLERAIGNLVENAIKYTPERGAIRVSAVSKGGNVEIQVADNGIGIPAADLPRIFERFYRVDKSRSRDMGGTGLGLSIVKHIAQAHGGSVEVTSESGKGTVFSILLPLSMMN